MNLQSRLTPRQFQILRLLATGMSRPDAARAIGITYGTLRFVISQMIVRLDGARPSEWPDMLAAHEREHGTYDDWEIEDYLQK